MKRNGIAKDLFVFLVAGVLLAFVVELCLWDPERTHRTIVNESDCTVVDMDSIETVNCTLDHGAYTPQGEDPQMLIKLDGGPVAGVHMHLSEPLSGNMMTQLFYPDENGILSQSDSVSSPVNQGDTDIYYSIPEHAYPFIRIDLDDPLKIDQIRTSRHGFTSVVTVSVLPRPIRPVIVICAVLIVGLLFKRRIIHVEV